MLRAPAGVKEGKPSRSRERQPAAIVGHIGHVVGDQSIGTRQHLLFAARSIETHQPVGSGDINCAVLIVPIFDQEESGSRRRRARLRHAETAVVSSQKIEAAIEISNPQSAVGIGRKCGNIAVG